MYPFRIGLCQIVPGRDLTATIDHAFSSIAIAAAGGADLVVLPEMFYCPYVLQEIRKIGDMSRLLGLFSAAAKRHEIYVCTGSIALRGRDGRLRNTSCIIDPSGKTVFSYSKCHMFDTSINGKRVTESSVFAPGNTVGIVKTELCTIGVLICYDIRFPEMARSIALSGAELLLVPAAFNSITGAAHWHLMLRARAVENQIFVAAISQGRADDPRFSAYGHSLVATPWGDCIAEAGDGDEIIFADLDPRLLAKTRKQLPLLKQRRPEVYGIKGRAQKTCR